MDSPLAGRGSDVARMLVAFSCLMLAWFCQDRAAAQVVWTGNTDVPLNISSNARLKYGNNSFSLVWTPLNSYPGVAYVSDLKPAQQDTPVPFAFTVNPQTMGIDPAPGTKRLTIRYATSTGEYTASVSDGSMLTIPNASHTRVGAGQTVSGFVVISAIYGTTNKAVDVKSMLRVKMMLLSPTYDSLQFNDFAYRPEGGLVLFGGGRYPSVGYPSSAGYYQVTEMDGFSYRTTETVACGAFGAGKLVMGISDPSFSGYNDGSHVSYTTPPNYSYYYWSETSIPANFRMKRVIFEDGKFVGVGTRQPDDYSSVTKGAVFVSYDGIEWITQVINGTTSLDAICRDPAGRWVAVGSSATVISSPNAFEWTKTTVPGAGYLTSVCSANGYCVVGSSSGKIYSTTNFSGWGLKVTASGVVTDIAAGDGKFMALAGTKIYQSAFAPPGIADVGTQPAGRFVVPQQSVSLSVVAAGTPPFSYQWYAGSSGATGSPVEGATEATFQTPALEVSAKYWVKVTNALGSANSDAASLVMQTPPMITVQPAGKTLVMGTSVSTTVAVAGENIHYQWYKGFTGDVSSPVSGQTSASLTLPSVQPGSAYYWVRAWNDLGSVDSESLLAQVTPLAPSIYGQPFDAITWNGEAEYLGVDARGPYLSYQWYAGSSGDTSHPLAATSSSYVPITGVTGVFRYWVRVSNSVGSVDSRTVTYTVLAPRIPVISQQPPDLNGYVDAMGYLTVSAAGNNLSYMWFAGESGDTSLPVYASDYFYPPDNEPGTWRYWVRVSNGAGHVDSQAVTVVVKAQETGLITRQPLDNSSLVGRSVSISVTAAGTGITYQWYSGNSGDTSAPVSGGTSYYLYPPYDTIGQKPYWVRVTAGAVAQDSATAVFSVVPQLLVITDQTLYDGIYLGDSAYLSVSTGASNVTRQWYRGQPGDTSQPVAGATSGSISPVPTATGIHDYWVRLSLGSNQVDSEVMKVMVLPRQPFIIAQPQDLVATTSVLRLAFSVGLQSSTGATYQWFQGLSGETSNPLSGSTGSSLTVSDPPAGIFRYWVRITNPSGSTDSRTATATVTPSGYSQWLVRNGFPEDASGPGGRGMSPAGDGLANLMKFALGMSATDSFGSPNLPLMGSTTIGGETYLTLRFVQLTGVSGVQLGVEESTDIATWTSSAIECGPSYDNGDGTRTRTFRMSSPVGATGGAYLRLKAASN